MKFKDSNSTLICVVKSGVWRFVKFILTVPGYDRFREGDAMSVPGPTIPSNWAEVKMFKYYSVVWSTFRMGGFNNSRWVQCQFLSLKIIKGASNT